MDRFLAEHGTVLMDLPPGAIAGAAKNDLKMRCAKAADKAKREATGENYETVDVNTHYAFLARHVHKADCAADLIRRAIADRARGAQSGKPTTRLIYEDEAKLKAALEIARVRG